MLFLSLMHFLSPQHYQSFRPKHGFWLDLAEVQGLVQGGKKSVSGRKMQRGSVLTYHGNQLPHPTRYYEGLLKAPLVSFRDQQEYRNMVELKSHLGRAWLAELRAKVDSSGAGHEKRRGAGDEEHKPPKSQRTIETDGGTDG